MAIPAIHMAVSRLRPAEDARARFDALLSPLLVPLYRFAHGMTHNTEDAEDLVQEAVVHAYRAFGSFRSGTNFKAWLFRICVNLYVDTYRTRQRAPALLPLMETDVDEGPSAPRTLSPEDELMDRVMEEELERALRALPDTFRAVVLLSDMEGLAYEEIATALAIPIGTVRSRLFRARAQMRAALDGFGRQRGLVEGER